MLIPSSDVATVPSTPQKPFKSGLSGSSLEPACLDFEQVLLRETSVIPSIDPDVDSDVKTAPNTPEKPFKSRQLSRQPAYLNLAARDDWETIEPAILAWDCQMRKRVLPA